MRYARYIKELAERLNTLESQMQPSMSHADMQYQMNEVSSPRGYQEFSPPMDGSLLSRKRTFSMSEGFSSSAFPQPPFQHRTQPIGSWSSFTQAQTLQPNMANVNPGDTSNILPDFLTGTMGNGTAAKNGVPFWSSGDTEHGLPAHADVPDVKPAVEDTTPVEIDEGALNAYVPAISNNGTGQNLTDIQVLSGYPPHSSHSAQLKGSCPRNLTSMQP